MVRYVKGLAIVLMAVVAAPQSAVPTLAITGIAVVDAARGAANQLLSHALEQLLARSKRLRDTDGWHHLAARLTPPV